MLKNFVHLTDNKTDRRIFTKENFLIIFRMMQEKKLKKNRTSEWLSTATCNTFLPFPIREARDCRSRKYIRLSVQQLCKLGKRIFFMFKVINEIINMQNQLKQ